MRAITFITLPVSLLLLRLLPFRSTYLGETIVASAERSNPFPVSTGIYGNCSDFPIPPDNGREFLEIDMEGPSDDGPDDASPVNVTYTATDLELGVVDSTGSP